ncbi:hypothetical protein BGW37DRAFT_486430 [Umbelopsis sp. PMI_123]|nr:hypothetical protein BGW37DRAFT_486430 [Umbelopsis sp. PMI_123]
MKKFLSLTKPIDEDNIHRRHRFPWSWRPKRSSGRRKTISFAATTEPAVPEKGLLPIQTNPEHALRHPTGANDPSNAAYTRTQVSSNTLAPVSSHPLAIPKDTSRWSERDLKVRTWPYHLAVDQGDTSDDDDGDHSTDHFLSANIILTPPTEDPAYLPSQHQLQSSFSSTMEENRSFMPNAHPQPPSLPKESAAAHNSSKNRSGDTMEKKVRNASMHSNSDNYPHIPSSVSGSNSDYRTPNSSIDSLLPLHPPTANTKQYHNWPRDTSTDDSFPAAINCAARFTFLPPGGGWRPGRDYKHMYLVNGGGCHPASIDDNADILRAKLAQAQETISQLQQTITNMEKRLLPSPDTSDDEMSPQSSRRHWKHHNFSEDILQTNMHKPWSDHN